MKFDLSDWENRKAPLLNVLGAAVGEGLVQKEQTAKLAEFLLLRGVDVKAVPQVVADGLGLDTPLAAEPVSSIEESEAPRFIRGFHDILITIGIIVGLLGLGGLATVYSVIPAAIILGEILVRRQRLALPAVVLTIAIALASAIGIYPLLDGNTVEEYARLPVYFSVAISLVTLAFYWRYQVPLALAAGLTGMYAAIVLTGVLAVQNLSNNPALFLQHPSLTAVFIGLFAVLVFGTALKFDFDDRNRVTRRSDVAFWMHLAAAPAILYTIMASIYFGNGQTWFSASTSALQAAAIVSAVLLLMLIGIVLDRRAFVTSGLLSFGYAFKVLLTEGGFAKVFASTETMAFVTLLTVGIIVLSLGIGWQLLRRAIVGNLPTRFQDMLPPVR